MWFRTLSMAVKQKHRAGVDPRWKCHMRFDEGWKALSAGAVIARRDAHDTAKYLTEVALIDKAGASACLQH